jgi:hypothetical protein
MSLHKSTCPFQYDFETLRTWTLLKTKIIGWMFLAFSGCPTLSSLDAIT